MVAVAFSFYVLPHQCKRCSFARTCVIRKEQKMRLSSNRVLASLVLGAALIPSASRANISGFGNFSGFTVNQGDAGTPPSVSGGTILMTDAAQQDRSIFCDTPQSIATFTASFVYTANPTFEANQGACFVLENSAAGAGALGSDAQFGYQGFPGQSVAITLETDSAGSDSGYYTNGVYGGGSPSTAPVTLSSSDPIDVTLTYNGTTLQESLRDTVTDASYNNTFLILTPIPTVLEGSTAYVGIVAATGADGADQSISNLQFSSVAVPEPASLSLLGTGAAGLLMRRRRAGCSIAR